MMLPEWLEPLPDAERMRAADAAAIAAGTPGSELMDRAGHALAGVVAEAVPAGRIAVLCGKGGNGGDGYVAARVLRAAGRDVVVVAVCPTDELSGDAAGAFAALAGDPPVAWSAGVLDGVGGAVDCLLGTGTSGAPRGAAGEAVAALARRELVVVACDIPSGVDASTGAVAGAAVRATVTATFAAAPPGLWIAPGKGHAGRVAVLDIGLPERLAADAGLLTDAVLDLLPDRGSDSTKFSSGHVLVAGGSRGLTGAPCLSAQAAARAGAGYVTVAVPASLEAIFEGRLLEVMSVGLPDADGHHVADGVDGALAATRSQGALVVGPGLGRSDDAQDFARALARRATVGLVLDADGLNAHAGRLEELAARAAPTILTPHGGELARLLDTDSDAIRVARLDRVREAAERAQAVVVLKGDDTLIAAPGGPVAVSPGGAPGLATAGTGDVLSGVCGAFLAQGLDPFAAACAAVLTHLRAGQRAAAPHGPRAVIASDVIAALPAALAK